MPRTPEQEVRYQALAKMLGVEMPGPAPDRPGFMSRLGQGFANVPGSIAEGLTNAGITAANIFAAGPMHDPDADMFDPVRVPHVYDLPPAQDWSESLADVIPGLTAAVGTAMIPGGAVARGSQALGLLGKEGAAILGDVAGGAVLGAGQSPGEAAGTGTEFGLLGAANRFLPNPWLKVAANAAIPFTGQLLRGRDPTSRESLISMGANVIAPALLGQYARRGETSGDSLLRPPTQPPPQVDPSTGQIVPYIPLPRGFTMPGYARPFPEQAWESAGGGGRWSGDEPAPPISAVKMQGLPEEPQWIQPRPITPLALRNGDPLLRQGEAIQTGYTDPRIAAWEGIEPSAERTGIPIGAPFDPYRPHDQLLRLTDGRVEEAPVTPPQAPTPREDLLRPQTTAEQSSPTRDSVNAIWSQVRDARRGGDEQTAAILTQRAQSGEKELRRLSKLTEGGFADLSNPLLQYGAGAIAGGVINPLVDQDPEHSLLRKVGEGALRGVGLTAAAKGIRNIPYIARKMQVDLGVRPRRTEVEPFDRAQALRKQMGDVAAAKSVGLTEAHVEDFMLGTNKTGINPYGMGETGLGMEMAKRMEGAPETPAAKAPATPAAPAGSGDAAGAIRQAYEGLVRQTRFPAVRISDLARDSGVPVPQVQEYLRAQARQGKVALEGGDWSLAGDAERAASIRIGSGTDPRDVMLLARFMDMEPSGGMGLLGVKLPDVKGLLRREAEEYEKGNRTPLGWVARRLEQNFNLGKQVATGRAEQFSKGEERDFFNKAQPIIEGLMRTTKPESDALLRYEKSPRDPADVSLMRSSVRPEVAAAMLAGEKLEGYGQQLLGKGSGDPRKQSLVDETEGTYRTTKYKFATQPEEWIKDLRAKPQLRTDLVDEFVATNKFPGFNREEIEAQVDGFIQDKLRGEPDFGPSNPSKTDPHLWTKRRDLTAKEKAFLGEYTNPAQRMAFTLQKIGSNIAQAKKAVVLDEMGKKGELMIMTPQERIAAMATARGAGDTAKIEELASLKQVPVNPAFGLLSGKLVTHDVLDSLNAHNELWTGGWLKAFSGPTSWMKGMMTVANPGTHGRQILQMPLTAAIARVAPWELWPAAKMMLAKGKEWEEAVRNGIVGADFSAQELGRGALEMDATFNSGRTGKAWRAVKGAAQKAYGMPDNVIRFAAYHKAKARFFGEGNAQGLKGADLESFAQNKATDFVNRYTMNYGAVSNAVKVARETPFVSPFISYQAEMLRILKNLGEDALSGSASDRVWALGNLAGLIAAPLLAAKAFESKLSDKDQKEWDRIQKLSPSYSGSQIRVPLSKSKDGSFRYLNIANLVPAGDSAALARNLANGDGARIFASNPFFGWEKTPIFNTIAEQVKGRENVTDRKLETPVDRGRALLKEVLPPLTPYIGYEAQRIGAAFTPNAEGGLGITNARTGRSDTSGTALLRQAGLPLSDVKLQPLLRRAQSDFREEKARAGMELRQTRDTNATPAARQKAQEKYLATVREKQRQLLERIR